MLTITRSTDRIAVQTITILIYGSPGVGKTSIACTAEAPLLLDFDKGAHRSGFRRDCARIDTWADVAQMTEADLADYRTIIVDTVGRCLDVMAADIIRKNPKMQGYAGALSLQGYGALKAAYATWLGWLSSLGKDVVLIAHDKEDKKGDEMIMRPDIQGGSAGEVFKRADGAAYMYTSERKAILDFSPGAWLGKNPARFDPIVVPNLHDDRHFLAGVIGRAKDALNAMSDEQRRVVADIDAWAARAAAASTAAEINALVNEAAPLTSPVGPQAKHAVVARAKALGLEYRGKKGEGAYVEATTQAEATEGAA